jgi:hypothetical protein
LVLAGCNLVPSPNMRVPGADAKPPTVAPIRDAGAPPQAACAAPTAAERTRLANALGSAAPIRPICAERGGWLVEVATSPPTAWLVPAHGDATQLDRAWTIGPVYDFDGDGHPEATTIADEGELVIWFDGGARSSYVIGADGTHWLARDGKILVGSEGWAFAVAPGTGYYVPDTINASNTPGAYSCTSDAGEAAAVAHMLAHGRAAAPCTQLGTGDQVAQQRAIMTALLARRDLEGVTRMHFAWGCTSHGETPVVVGYDGLHDTTGSELWSVRDGRATLRDGVTSPAPGEWSFHDDIALGPSGDFDGDGAAESIIEHSHHAEAHGTTFAYEVMIGGAMRSLPSDLVIRGDRDGVVRTSSVSKPHVVTACHESDPNTQLDCELQPPEGYVKVAACGPWDWEKHAPEIVALGATKKFAPVSRAAVSALVAATAADRAALTTP